MAGEEKRASGRGRRKASPVESRKAGEVKAEADEAKAEETSSATPNLPARDSSETVVRDAEPAPAPKAAPKGTEGLAPKVDPPGPRRNTAYKVGGAADEDLRRRGLDRGDLSTAQEPRRFRVERTQTLLLRGVIHTLREGQVVSEQTHPIAYLEASGVALRPLGS